MRKKSKYDKPERPPSMPNVQGVWSPLNRGRTPSPDCAQDLLLAEIGERNKMTDDELAIFRGKFHNTEIQLPQKDQVYLKQCRAKYDNQRAYFKHLTDQKRLLREKIREKEVTDEECANVGANSTGHPKCTDSTILLDDSNYSTESMPLKPIPIVESKLQPTVFDDDNVNV